MVNVDIRKGTGPFSDAKRFPYGFRKSGDFSISEAQCLTTYGQTLLALEEGRLAPETDEEQRFVAVAQGQAEAQTAVEKCWLKYIKLARGRRAFFTLHSTNRNAAGNDDDIDDYSEDDFDVVA
ncbi:DUF413 domain-containing protein [Aestuariibacter halophilus]|uniref:Macrodomain Ori protein n=1 Tax=Fluctibacter halophilus TaxID=226011 RepID=A0ABS8GB10_9ALTE|nr:DUF413 domain-containing protein [Aestuariibacter halophilus]MCC2617583.1 DUF413 domain-containing protein [Aestuariibacter halophilus]